MADTRFLSASEVASLMKVNLPRAREFLRTGRIVGARKVGRDWRAPAPLVLKPSRRQTRWEQMDGRTQAGTTMDVHYTSDTPDWSTPPHIITCVTQALDGIDLDPCSEGKERSLVPATTHYTEAEDGLLHQWGGRVYMNPPYGRDIIRWVQHLIAEFREGRTTAAVALVPGRVETRWFRLLDEYIRCYIKGRLKFGGGKNSAPFPSVAVYLGTDTERFIDAFRSQGTISASL